MADLPPRIADSLASAKRFSMSAIWVSRVCLVLLSAQLLCETSSIHHRLLGFLLRVLRLVEHVVDLGLQSVNRSLEPALVGGGPGVDVVHLVDGHPGLSELGLG